MVIRLELITKPVEYVLIYKDITLKEGNHLPSLLINICQGREKNSHWGTQNLWRGGGGGKALDRGPPNIGHPCPHIVAKSCASIALIMFAGGPAVKRY